MSLRNSIVFATVAVVLVASSLAPAQAPAEGKMEGKFVVNGIDAQLKHARGVKMPVDGKQGYAVLLSARPATGDIAPWRTGDPVKRGSFVFVIFEGNGAIYISELAHDKAANTRFGVVTEVKKQAFEVRNNRLVAHIKTPSEQSFTQDKYTVDLKFDVPLE